MNIKKSIGILGGMGPLATADLFMKIVNMTKADKDSDHIRIYVDNHPQIPDRTAAILQGGESPLPYMLQSLRNLEKCRAECVIIPCNTAHYYLPQLRDSTDIPIISMLDETAKACKKRFGDKKAGVLATVGTLKTDLYKTALKKCGIEQVEPSERMKQVLMDIIYSVKAGNLPKDSVQFDAVTDEMYRQGAGYFILGCTELPMAAAALELDEDSFVDPTTELAKTAIHFCGYEILG